MAFSISCCTLFAQSKKKISKNFRDATLIPLWCWVFKNYSAMCVCVCECGWHRQIALEFRCQMPAWESAPLPARLRPIGIGHQRPHRFTNTVHASDCPLLFLVRAARSKKKYSILSIYSLTVSFFSLHFCCCCCWLPWTILKICCSYVVVCAISRRKWNAAICVKGTD